MVAWVLSVIFLCAGFLSGATEIASPASFDALRRQLDRVGKTESFRKLISKKALPGTLQEVAKLSFITTVWALLTESEESGDSDRVAQCDEVIDVMLNPYQCEFLPSDLFLVASCAAEYGDLVILRFLLEHRDVKWNNEHSSCITCLHSAIIGGQTAVVKYLVCRPDVNVNAYAKFSYGTPLYTVNHFCTGDDMCKEAIIESLMSSGSDLLEEPPIEVRKR